MGSGCAAPTHFEGRSCCCAAARVVVPAVCATPLLLPIRHQAGPLCQRNGHQLDCVLGCGDGLAVCVCAAGRFGQPGGAALVKRARRLPPACPTAGAHQASWRQRDANHEPQPRPLPPPPSPPPRLRRPPAACGSLLSSSSPPSWPWAAQCCSCTGRGRLQQLGSGARGGAGPVQQQAVQQQQLCATCTAAVCIGVDGLHEVPRGRCPCPPDQARQPGHRASSSAPPHRCSPPPGHTTLLQRQGPVWPRTQPVLVRCFLPGHLHQHRLVGCTTRRLSACGCF